MHTHAPYSLTGQHAILTGLLGKRRPNHRTARYRHLCLYRATLGADDLERRRSGELRALRGRDAADEGCVFRELVEYCAVSIPLVAPFPFPPQLHLTSLTSNEQTLHRPAIDSPPVKFVNTSMHGVSHPFVTRAFEILNFPSFTPVAEQKDPDPEFPTVRYPNPEEKGALVGVVFLPFSALDTKTVGCSFTLPRTSP